MHASTDPACVATNAPQNRVPLVVDLDGTLIASDLLIESAFARVGRDPLSIVGAALASARGKAQLKEFLADGSAFDPSTLPYDERVLARVREAVAAGRPVFLASASNERLVAAVAAHLGLFAGWFASDSSKNLSGPAKASRLVDAFGAGGFDYIGDDEADLAVWAVCAGRIAVGASARLGNKLSAIDPNAEFLPSSRPSAKVWSRALRVHQYAKNALVFVPLLTAHKLQLDAVLTAALAAMAFSLCASGVYMLNDLVDLNADRRHPIKRHRPFASGAVPVGRGVVAIPIVLAGAAALAAAVSWPFLGVIAGYFLLSTAYTFFLKRRLMVDIVALATLYTIRVIGGAVAIDVVMSEWLLAFSMFIFAALALIKRYVELAARLDAGLPDPSNRNYRNADLNIVGTLAAAAGFNAITIFALYISSDATHRLYAHPQVLWLICPILMYWIGRMLVLAHRRLIDDDPVAFALRDWNSLAAAICIVGVMIAAL